MALPKLVSSGRVGDQAFEAMHSAIMSGDFPSGHRLQIRELAADLGISVMPVREAIKRLEEIGLVESLPYRGATVKRLTPEELLHVYAVRKLLEVEAAKTGAAGVDSSVIERMERSFTAMTAALDRADVADYLDRDEEILAALYDASDNPVLVDTIRTLWYRCRPFKIVGARREIDAGDIEPLVTYQQRLIEALRAGDIELAATVTAESLDTAIARITGALDSSSEH